MSMRNVVAKTFVVALIIVIVIILFFWQKRETKYSITIGVITTMTGQSAKYGISALNGIKLAVSEINNAGGINGAHVKLIIEDDGSSVEKAVAAFKKLAVINKVPVIIGPISSSSAMACSPLANKYRVVLFSPSAATPDFSSPGDYTFRNRVSAKYEVEALAAYIYSELGIDSVAILFVNNEYGLGNKNAFSEYYSRLGGAVVFVESFDEGATDFRSIISKIKEINPKGIFFVGQGTEGGYALRQMYELGIQTRFFSTITIQRDDVIKIAGSAINGVIFAAPLYDPNISEKTRLFDQKYRKTYGMSSDIFAANGYDAVYILKLAIEKGGYDSERIKRALFSIDDFHGVTGLTTFDENGDVIKPVAIKMIRDEKVTILNEITLKKS